jgi:regulatory protein
MELNREQHDAFQKAAFLCSKAEKCSGDILKKLASWGLDDGDAAIVLKQLVEEKYVDDERYARSYVHDKFRFNKWGKIKIAYQLRANRVNPGVIDAALSMIDDEAYFETLVALVSEKNKSIKAVNPYDRKAKLIRFAQSRGFEMDLIYKALDRVS